MFWILAGAYADLPTLPESLQNWYYQVMKVRAEGLKRKGIDTEPALGPTNYRALFDREEYYDEDFSEWEEV